MVSREQGILGVAAVKAAAHPSHQSDDFLSPDEGTVREIDDFTRTFYAWNDGLLNVICLNFAEPKELFGMI